MQVVGSCLDFSTEAQYYGCFPLTSPITSLKSPWRLKLRAGCMVVVQCCTARHPYVDLLLSFYLSMITASMLVVRCRQFTRGSEVIGLVKGKQSAQEQETENGTSLLRHHPALCDTSTTRTYPRSGPRWCAVRHFMGRCARHVDRITR